MRKSMDKYFWDGNLNISEDYKLKRILEYASFPDLIVYPIAELKKYLPSINIDKLRTSQKRKTFIKLIIPLISESQSWDDIINRIISYHKF
ncbi:MAG: hypothetical protein ABIF11_01470 [Nitrospirota bacterium]